MLSARTVQLATDAPYYPAKTPARTRNRRENVYQGAMTVHNGKTKNINLLRTPFQPKSAQPQRVLKPSEGKAPPIQLVVTKPLADKTPFINRVLDNYKTPGQSLKPGPLLDGPPNTNPTPGSTRASSTRKHARIPKPQAYHDFQTPANVGNHWDISEDDIVVPEEVAETEKETEEEPLDLNDEIEYMAPNTLNLEYQPPFDFELPNYKQLGEDILHNFCRYSEEPAALPPPSFEFTFKDEDFMKWDDLSLPFLPSLDEDPGPASNRGPGARPNLKPSQVTRTKQISSSVASKKAVGSSRSVSATNLRSKFATPASTHPNRPASSVSLKPPPSSTAGTAKPKARASATITTTSASSRVVRKPTTTSAISAKTKPAPSTTAPAATKRPTSTNGSRQSASNPRPSSAVKPIRPVSASGVRGGTTATSRATNATPIKRPNTSTSVTRPGSKSLTTTMTARGSGPTSARYGMKSSLRTTSTAGAIPATTSGVKVEKKSSSTACGAVTSRTMTRANTTLIPTAKGKPLPSHTTVKNSHNSKSSLSRVPTDVDVACFERAIENKGNDSNDHVDSDGDGDDDGDIDVDDEEETIRCFVPIRKPETQDNANNNGMIRRGDDATRQSATARKDPEVNLTAEYIYQGIDNVVKREEESNLSVVDEVTEVSVSVEIIEKIKLLKLE